MSFALARPYSLALLAHGRIKFPVRYSDGILCYMYEDLVRFLDVHGASETEDVIDVVALMAQLPGYGPNTTTNNIGHIFNYENGILTMRSVYSDIPTMVVIDARRDFVSTPQDPSRIRKILREPMPQQSWHIITDGRYLVCVHAPENAPDWTLKYYDLTKKENSVPTIVLDEFLLKGWECRFKIIDGWFYAICRDENGQYNVARGDDTKELYYNCCRFPLGCGFTEMPEFFTGHLDSTPYIPLPAGLEVVQIFRGVGKEAWTHSYCYDIVKDEREGKLFIVESTGPTERPQSDRPYRPLVFPKPVYTVSSWETKIRDIVQIQPNSKYVHQPSEYELRKEETREHVQPSQSIIDVTWEHLKEGQVMHLGQPSQDIRDVTNEYQQVVHLYASSSHRGVWRFPPQGAPKELRDLLPATGPIWALADERSLIVITVGINSEGQEIPRVLLVNFDAGIHFPSFDPLTLDHISDDVTPDRGSDSDDLRRRNASPPEQLRQLQFRFLRQPKKVTPGPKPAAADTPKPAAAATPKAEAPDANPWFSTGREAMYLTTGKGYRLHQRPPRPTPA